MYNRPTLEFELSLITREVIFVVVIGGAILTFTFVWGKHAKHSKPAKAAINRQQHYKSRSANLSSNAPIIFRRRWDTIFYAELLLMNCGGP